MALLSAEGIKKPNPNIPPIHFNASPGPSLGVEIELILVDLKTMDMAPRAEEFLAALGPDSGDWAKHEAFQGIVEIITKKCHTIEDVRADFSYKLKRVLDTADKLGLGVMGGGLHPFAKWAEQPVTNKERYLNLIGRMGWPARQLLCTGTHVHVGIESGEKAVALMNSICCYLPHILALSASSPFWQGSDTNLSCARLKILQLLPTAGLPPHVTNWAELVRLMRTLINAGAITSIREIWWDVRPHPGLGTLEVRIADNLSSPTELLALTSFIWSLVVFLGDLYDHGLPLPNLSLWTLNENKWRAIRWAEECDVIRNEAGDQAPMRDHLRGVLSEVRPYAVKLGCSSYLPVLDAMLEYGPSYKRQRTFYRETGSLPKLVENLVGAFRNDEPFGRIPHNVPGFYD